MREFYYKLQELLMDISMKWIIATIIIIGCLSYSIYLKSIFRFQNFNSSQEITEYLKERFPMGSDSKPLLEFIKKAGAECEEIDKKYFGVQDPKNTEEIWDCRYSHFEFSVKLIIAFNITIYNNSSGQIINFYIGRHGAYS